MNAPAPIPVNGDPASDRVRCLDCGFVYAKPFGRGTVTSNPGCPRCGYIGWVDESLPVTPAMLRNRSVADLQRSRTDRRR
jgi:hypothetical protein